MKGEEKRRRENARQSPRSLPLQLQIAEKSERHFTASTSVPYCEQTIWLITL